MQQNVIDHVSIQCEKLSAETRLIEEGSQPFDSVDLTSLSAVKDFLHREQVMICLLFIFCCTLITLLTSGFFTLPYLTLHNFTLPSGFVQGDAGLSGSGKNLLAVLYYLFC